MRYRTTSTWKIVGQNFPVTRMRLPVAVSLIYGLSPIVVFGLTSLTIMICILASFIGSYYGSRYCDIDEKPRSTYVRGTGMMLAFMLMGGLGLAGGAPIIFYLLMKPLALSFGLTSTYSILASISIFVALSLVVYRLAASSMKRLFSEFVGG